VSPVIAEKVQSTDTDKVEKRCERMCDMMEMFLSNCAISSQPVLSPVAASVPNFARSLVQVRYAWAPGPSMYDDARRGEDARDRRETAFLMLRLSRFRSFGA